MTAVRVLVPVHDQAAFMGRALASLRDQDLQSWEAVLLDDGSSDVWDPTHLASVLAALDARPELDLVWSGVRHHDGETSRAAPPGHPLQLVQVTHRRTDQRWTERSELESDDLGRLMWDPLGDGAGTGLVTCERTIPGTGTRRSGRRTTEGSTSSAAATTSSARCGCCPPTVA